MRKPTVQLASDVRFAVAEAVTQKFGFIARSGGGKTYAAGKLVEGLLQGRAQVAVFDPVGNWYGLRLHKDGGPSGFDIPVFGGEHGDLPLVHTAGALVADVVVTRGISAVLDLSSFRKNQRKQFVTDFCEQLFHRKKTNRSPLHVVFEEAQVFAPQRVSRGEERLLGAVEDICRLGRNYGIGTSLISQRPQSVNKEVLNQVECLVTLQTNGRTDRKAIREWAAAKANEAEAKSLEQVLPSLEVGEAVIWSPQWLKCFIQTRICPKTTFDASATPELGEVAAPEISALTDADLASLREAMQQVQDEAEQHDPTALQRRIRELESENRRLEKALLDVQPQTVEVSVPVLSEEVLSSFWKRWAAQVEASQRVFEDLAQELSTEFEKASSHFVRAVASPPAPSQPEAVQPRRARVRKFRAGAVRMLEALAKRPALTKQELGTLSGMKLSGTFSTYLGELKRSGLVEERDKQLAITADGRSFLEERGVDVLVPQTVEEIRALWLPRFRRGARHMLEELFESPRGMTRRDLARAVEMSPTSGTFGTYLGDLRRNGLVHQQGDVIVASNLLLYGPRHAHS